MRRSSTGRPASTSTLCTTGAPQRPTHQLRPLQCCRVRPGGRRRGPLRPGLRRGLLLRGLLGARAQCGARQDAGREVALSGGEGRQEPGCLLTEHRHGTKALPAQASQPFEKALFLGPEQTLVDCSSALPYNSVEMPTARESRLSACCLAPNSSSAWRRHEAHSKRRRRKAAHGAQRKVPADGGARPGSGLQRPAGTRPLCVSCLWCTPSAACQRWTDLCRWTPLHWLARWPSGRRGRRGLRSGTGARPAHPKRTASVMPTLLVSAAACSCLMAKKPAWGAAQ